MKLWALEPDGQAAACKAAESGFDSHRRLSDYLWILRTLSGIPWSESQPKHSGTAAPIQLAQMVEQQILNLCVEGSIPSLQPLTRNLPRSLTQPGTRTSIQNNGCEPLG